MEDDKDRWNESSSTEIEKLLNYFFVCIILLFIIGAGLAVIWTVFHHCYCRESFHALHTNEPRNITGGVLERDAGLRLTTDERIKALEAALIQKNLTKEDIEIKLRENTESCCSICLAEYEEGDTVISSTHCCHEFHKSCLLEWLKSHDCCPNCRKDVLTPSELKEVSNQIFSKSQLLQIKARPYNWEQNVV